MGLVRFTWHYDGESHRDIEDIVADAVRDALHAANPLGGDDWEVEITAMRGYAQGNNPLW